MKKSEEPVNYMPPRLRGSIFVAVRDTVKRGSDVIARARSSTFARRIANALNKYTPGEKGY